MTFLTPARRGISDFSSARIPSAIWRQAFCGHKNLKTSEILESHS